MRNAISVLVKLKVEFLLYDLLIGMVSFVFLVLAIGERVGQFMNAKIKYTDEPLGEMKVVHDFLPPPEQLAFNEEGVKVTLALSKKSVDFFKSEAAKHHTQYQRMIRRLVDAYVDSYSPPLTRRSTPTRKRAG
jgi:hypothetical protein